MSIIIFILVIVALIVVHEFGHFVAAKLVGMRVEEFGLGYPPRAATLARHGGTLYTLNWLSFGGFVKIHGENGGEKDSGAFTAKSRLAQAVVLVAGVAMNLLFAYMLITAALVAGMPRALDEGDLAVARDRALIISNVLPGSPAARAGLVAGDMLESATGAAGAWQALDPQSFSAFIAASKGSEVTLMFKRNGSEQELTATPAKGVVPAAPSRYALGVEVAATGVVAMPIAQAITEGARLTWGATVLTAEGLWHFFAGVFSLSADLSQVAGPVGIAGVVGSASSEGWGSLFSIMALISINLALINLIPVPALDGGRLLFVIIEAITRRPIKARIAHAVNAIGFALLVLLMVVVTAHDIFKILG